MKRKPAKAKSQPGKARTLGEKESAVFLAALERHGQVQGAEGPLERGVTHVKKSARKGKVKIVRKRFSAI